MRNLRLLPLLALVTLTFGLLSHVGMVQAVTLSDDPTLNSLPLLMTCEAGLLNNDGVAFLSHVSAAAGGSYLAMNLKPELGRTGLAQLQNKLGRNLKNRGEAHVTVVTPPEYDQALKGFVPIDEINQIAAQMDVQNSDLQLICLGSQSAHLKSGEESTYYVVVRSENLIHIRQEIQRRFLARGGDAERFKAEPFYSHITIGFTARDLFESDGAIKDRKSCLYRLR